MFLTVSDIRRRATRCCSQSTYLDNTTHLKTWNNPNNSVFSRQTLNSATTSHNFPNFSTNSYTMPMGLQYVIWSQFHVQSRCKLGMSFPCDVTMNSISLISQWTISVTNENDEVPRIRDGILSSSFHIDVSEVRNVISCQKSVSNTKK